MDSETVVNSSALATALIASPLVVLLARGTARLDAGGAPDGAAGELGRPGQAAARNPAELLASLLDFPGSVALAELLEDDARALPRSGDPKGVPGRVLPAGSGSRADPRASVGSRADPRASVGSRADPRASVGSRADPRASTALGERLLWDAEARLDSLEPSVLKPLTGRRAPSILTPADLLFQLSRHGVIEARSEANVQRFADDLGAPFRSALGLSLRQAQAHVATLRWEITHDLRALGPRAERLERLDAAISRSMQAKLGELLDRMEYAAHLTFVRACVHAVEALPEQVDEEQLVAWCDANGWLVRYRERCVRMAKALYGHLRRNLEGLMRAASENDDWMGDP